MTTTDLPVASATPDLSDEAWARLLRIRATDRDAVANAYAARRRPPAVLSQKDSLFLVAADHPARGALASGGDDLAMADRRSLLARLVAALENPNVDGVLGTPDVVEELLLLGVLEGKVVIGSMNRGGLDGATWTMDDRFTGYDAASIAAHRLDGGKMLLRIDDQDSATAGTIEGCATAVSELADHGLIAMVEPLPYHRNEDGSLTLLKDAKSLARAITIASGLGTTSAFTWLKMPSCADPDLVFSATTLPCVVLGGVPSPDPGPGPALVGPSARPAGCPRPGRRPRAALPTRRGRTGRSGLGCRRPAGRAGGGGRRLMSGTVRLTTAQALVRWMTAQRSELLDGRSSRCSAVCSGSSATATCSGSAPRCTRLATSCRPGADRPSRGWRWPQSPTRGRWTAGRSWSRPPRSVRVR